MNYKEILFTFLLSFILTYLLVPLNIKFSRKFKLIDYPHERGIHKKEIPLAGGLSFAIPILILQILLYFNYKLFGFEKAIGLQILKLAIGSFFILILGYLDDKRKFTARYKLVFQIIIIIAMYFMGFRMTLLTNPFGEGINLGLLSFPMTIVWFIFVINAFNLIDGIDGLAAGIVVITTAVLSAVSIVFSNQLIALLALIIMGSNLAFLRYNFYPAQIFMGDTGSLFIGFNIAAISIFGASQFKGITTMTLLIPITVLIIPISDTIMAIFRRIKRKKNIFQADKEHIHHKLLEIGLSQKSIAVICYFVTFLFGLIAFGFSFVSKEILLVILILLTLIVLIILYFIFKKGKRL